MDTELYRTRKEVWQEREREHSDGKEEVLHMSHEQWQKALVRG